MGPTPGFAVPLWGSPQLFLYTVSREGRGRDMELPLHFAFRSLLCLDYKIGGCNDSNTPGLAWEQPGQMSPDCDRPITAEDDSLLGKVQDVSSDNFSPAKKPASSLRAQRSSYAAKQAGSIPSSEASGGV